MNYLVAVLTDRMVAEEAYLALEKNDIPVSSVSILGKGYKSADEFGFIDPKAQGIKQAKRMAYWLVPFGFFGGVTFTLATQLNTFPWAGYGGNLFIGGLLGAFGGSMGSLFAGGGTGLIEGSGDALPYRNRLKEGRYIVIVQGTGEITRRATPILQSFKPSNIQGYSDGPS